jgi:hypothetical protein
VIKKIVSGGQTGADRAALDFAIGRGILHGGWVPKGRRTEDGRLPERYHVNEMASASYPKRTERNVIDSDGTVVITHGAPTGGSALTLKMARAHGRPSLHLDLDRITVDQAAEQLLEWIVEFRISVLNVAGPRASEDPKIYDAAIEVLTHALIG